MVHFCILDAVVFLSKIKQQLASCLTSSFKSNDVNSNDFATHAFGADCCVREVPIVVFGARLLCSEPDP